MSKSDITLIVIVILFLVLWFLAVGSMAMHPLISAFGKLFATFGPYYGEFFGELGLGILLLIMALLPTFAVVALCCAFDDDNEKDKGEK